MATQPDTINDPGITGAGAGRIRTRTSGSSARVVLRHYLWVVCLGVLASALLVVLVVRAVSGGPGCTPPAARSAAAHSASADAC